MIIVADKREQCSRGLDAVRMRAWRRGLGFRRGSLGNRGADYYLEQPGRPPGPRVEVKWLSRAGRGNGDAIASTFANGKRFERELEQLGRSWPGSLVVVEGCYGSLTDYRTGSGLSVSRAVKRWFHWAARYQIPFIITARAPAFIVAYLAATAGRQPAPAPAGFAAFEKACELVAALESGRAPSRLFCRFPAHSMTKSQEKTLIEAMAHFRHFPWFLDCEKSEFQNLITAAESRQEEHETMESIGGWAVLPSAVTEFLKESKFKMSIYPGFAPGIEPRSRARGVIFFGAWKFMPSGKKCNASVAVFQPPEPGDTARAQIYTSELWFSLPELAKFTLATVKGKKSVWKRVCSLALSSGTEKDLLSKILSKLREQDLTDDRGRKIIGALDFAAPTIEKMWIEPEQLAKDADGQIVFKNESAEIAEKAVSTLYKALAASQLMLQQLGKKGKGARCAYVKCDDVIAVSRRVLLECGLVPLVTEAVIEQLPSGQTVLNRTLRLVHLASGEHLDIRQQWPVVADKRMTMDHAAAAADSFGLTYLFRGLLLFERGEEDDIRTHAEPKPAPLPGPVAWTAPSSADVRACKQISKSTKVKKAAIEKLIAANIPLHLSDKLAVYYGFKSWEAFNPTPEQGLDLRLRLELLVCAYAPTNNLEMAIKFVSSYERLSGDKYVQEEISNFNKLIESGLSPAATVNQIVQDNKEIPF